MKSLTKTSLLLFGDILALYFSLAMALILRYGTLNGPTSFSQHFWPFTILFVVWIVVFYIYNLYDLTSAKNTLTFYTNMLRMIVVAFSVAVFFFYFIPFFSIAPKRNLFIFLIVFTIVFALWRQIINHTLKSRLNAPTIIVGKNARVLPLATVLNNNPQIGYRVVVVFLQTKPDNYEKFPFEIKTSRDFPKLVNLIKQHKVQKVITEESAYRSKHVLGGLSELLRDNIEVNNLEDFEEELNRKVRLENINELWLLRHVAKGRHFTYDSLKRLLDIIVALVLLPIALILGLITAILIKLDDGGPIFYTQKRIGKNEKIFTMIKFRTMRTDAEKDGARWTVENDSRTTRIGRFLRKTRLDEFPQIINILWGDLAFVGPRAERPEFHEMLKKEIPFYEQRYLIKPGGTGWAQINYTYGSSVDDTKVKLSYDFYYLKNRSVIFDIGVILKTINLVLSAIGR